MHIWKLDVLVRLQEYAENNLAYDYNYDGRRCYLLFIMEHMECNSSYEGIKRGSNIGISISECFKYHGLVLQRNRYFVIGYNQLT